MIILLHERATWDNFGFLICNMGKANDVAHCCWQYEPEILISIQVEKRVGRLKQGIM